MKDKSLLGTIIGYFIPGFILNKATKKTSRDPLDEFITNLASDDYHIRKKTAEVLGNHANLKVIKPLINTAIKDENEDIRREAFESLKRLASYGQPVAEELQSFIDNQGDSLHEPLATRVDGLTNEFLESLE